MGILSANLSVIPFASSIDSTRLQMTSKYLSQSVIHPNCQIPYVVCNKYTNLTNYSQLGIKIAESSGKILYKGGDIIIYMYHNDDSIKIDFIPPFKRTYGVFSNQLRHSLEENNEFNADDVIWEYDCFNQGIPTFGLNTNVAIIPFFGFVHEDAITVSESYAEKSKVTFSDKIYVPIFRNTLLHKIYSNIPNSFDFFPSIGQELKEDVLCSIRIPNRHVNNSNFASKDRNTELLNALKTSNLSDFISSYYEYDKGQRIKSKIESGGILTGLKVHKLKKEELLDLELQNVLDNMYTMYGAYVSNIYGELYSRFGELYTKKILKRYHVFADKDIIRGNINFKDAIYLLEFEITKESKTFLGDKLTTRSASKGVISLILPDELMPVSQRTGKHIECIINPFGFFSRMNTGGATAEGIVGKCVEKVDNIIKTNPSKTISELTWLNEGIIKNINDRSYYDKVKDHINNLNNDNLLLDKFIENVQRDNLYVEVPDFAKINNRQLVKNAVPSGDPILIKSQTIDYMKHKLKIENMVFNTEDVVLKNHFVAPLYLMKLYKIAAELMNSRDFGNVTSVTGMPTRGRRNAGGLIILGHVKSV